MHSSLPLHSLFSSFPPPPSSSSFYFPSSLLPSLLSSFLSLLPSFLLSDYRGQKGKQQKSPKSTLSPTSRTQNPPGAFPSHSVFLPQQCQPPATLSAAIISMLSWGGRPPLYVSPSPYSLIRPFVNLQ